MPRTFTIALAMVVLALLLATPYAGTQALDQVEVRIRWVTYTNPTKEYDLAFGTCVFGDYIAVVGKAGEGPLSTAKIGKPYVVLLRKSDGVVVREWIGSVIGTFYNCISIDGKLYAIGELGLLFGVIYVFDENLNVLAEIWGERDSLYYSLAYSDGALYIGGWAWEDADGDGYLQHVGLVGINLSVNSKKIYSKKIYFGSWEHGEIYDIGVDPSTGRIWAVGYYIGSDGILRSLIVILDSGLRALRVIDYPPGSEGHLGWLFGIAFDGRYVYISGSDGVAKFSTDGELVAINRDGKARYKIVYYNNYLYTFGQDRIGGYWRHVLYIHDTNLNLVKVYVLNGNVNADSYFSIIGGTSGRPALEGNNVYVAGYDYAPGKENSRVVVYSLSLEGVTVTSTEAATATVAATVATVTPIAQTITTATGTEGALAATTAAATAATEAATATTAGTAATAVAVASPATVAVAIPIAQAVPVVQTVTVTVVSPTTVVEREAVAPRIPVVSVLTAPTTIYVVIAGLAAVGIVIAVASLITATTTPNKTTTQTILIALATTGAILAIILLLLTI